jgi:hypothetical protein
MSDGMPASGSIAVPNLADNFFMPIAQGSNTVDKIAGPSSASTKGAQLWAASFCNGSPFNGTTKKGIAHARLPNRECKSPFFLTNTMG